MRRSTNRGTWTSPPSSGSGSCWSSGDVRLLADDTRHGLHHDGARGHGGWSGGWHHPGAEGSGEGEVGDTHRLHPRWRGTTWQTKIHSQTPENHWGTKYKVQLRTSTLHFLTPTHQVRKKLIKYEKMTYECSQKVCYNVDGWNIEICRSRVI